MDSEEQRTGSCSTGYQFVVKRALNSQTLSYFSEEYLADLQAGIDELKNAAPQDEEERHNLFLLKKQVVDTLVERVTINNNREIMVEIRLNLLAILDEDAKSEEFTAAAYSKRDETYTHIPDMYRAGVIFVWV
jgi:hypothetical protein